MGDPARELPDGLEALVLDHLRVHRQFPGDVADVQDRPDIFAVFSRDRAPRHERSKEAIVLAAEAQGNAFAGVGRLTLQKRRDLLPVRLIYEGDQRPAAHLLLGRAQEPGHRAVRVGRPTVGSHHPDAVEHPVED